MAVDFIPETRARFPVISWPAIFAALTVGVSIQLLLTLAGFALGVYALDTANDTGTITLAAASWGATSMLASSLIGGYVAARSSGLRRTSDGVLHGVVSWGATTLLYAALATTAIGSLTTGLFGLLGSGVDGASPSASVGAEGDRERALRALSDLGMSADQARGVLDQLAGAGGQGAPATRDAGDVVGSATLWLSAAVLLSLVLGMLGGIMGARGSRRILRRERSGVTERSRILSRT